MVKQIDLGSSGSGAIHGPERLDKALDAGSLFLTTVHNKKNLNGPYLYSCQFATCQ